jgi:hypothetical protein
MARYNSIQAKLNADIVRGSEMVQLGVKKIASSKLTVVRGTVWSLLRTERTVFSSPAACRGKN